MFDPRTPHRAGMFVGSGRKHDPATASESGPYCSPWCEVERHAPWIVIARNDPAEICAGRIAVSSPA